LWQAGGGAPELSVLVRCRERNERFGDSLVDQSTDQVLPIQFFLPNGTSTVFLYVLVLKKIIEL
jgi:hypothetical protein